MSTPPSLDARPSHRPRLNSLRSTTATSTRTVGNRPPSPTFSTTTVGSQLPRASQPPGLLITRADLRTSLQAYEDLMTASKSYRQAVLSKAKATAELASALESCSRVKGANQSGPGLQASAGFYFVVSNGENVLADQFYKSFEIPLLHSLDSYKQETIDRQVAYESLLVTKTKALRDTEAENIQLGRNKKGKGPGRDLSSFRKTLELLQRQVDEIDVLKADYHEEVAEGEEEIWEEVLSSTGTVLKTQLDIYDRLVSSMTADAILEPMLAANPDPFEAYDQPDPSSQYQSILPPIGMPSTLTTSSSTSSKASPSRALRTTSSKSLSLSQSTNGTALPSSNPSSSSNADPNDEAAGTLVGAGSSGRSRSVSLEGNGGEEEDGFLSPRKEPAGFSFLEQSSSLSSTPPPPPPAPPFPAPEISSSASSSSSSSSSRRSPPPILLLSSDPSSPLTSSQPKPIGSPAAAAAAAKSRRSRRMLSVIGDVEGAEEEEEEEMDDDEGGKVDRRVDGEDDKGEEVEEEEEEEGEDRMGEEEEEGEGDEKNDEGEEVVTIKDAASLLNEQGVVVVVEGPKGEQRTGEHVPVGSLDGEVESVRDEQVDGEEVMPKDDTDLPPPDGNA